MVNLSIGFFVLIMLIVLLVGFVLGTSYFKSKKHKSNNTIIPENFAQLSHEEVKAIELYQKEWEAVLETQRHFNNLTIKFRGFALTGFIFLAGAAFTAEGLFRVGDIDNILLLITFFWIGAAILDMLYYYRLLIGSVEYAYEKFDQHDWLKSKGFFGLTTKVKHTIPPWQSQVIIFMYYFIPILALWVFYFATQVK